MRRQALPKAFKEPGAWLSRRLVSFRSERGCNPDRIQVFPILDPESPGAPSPQERFHKPIHLIEEIFHRRRNGVLWRVVLSPIVTVPIFYTWDRYDEVIAR